MKIWHPNNVDYVPLSALSKYCNDGYYDIIDANESIKLQVFLKSYEDHSRSQNLEPFNHTLYQDLPYSIHTKVWKERQKDLKIIDELLQNKPNSNILDVGSWNGWLSNRLSINGHNVVAVNIFTDEINGLKSQKNYDTKFISLHLLPHEIYRIKHSFDVIIFNRNWAHLQNRGKIFNDAKNRLTKNGIIVFTGLAIYKNSTSIRKTLKIADEEFRNKYGIPLYFFNSKGYLDYSDLPFFRSRKIKLFEYHPLRSLIKTFFSKKAKLYYGIYQK
ncbi:class I SAM-dependent methyltransferase [Geojedonia litorea]|uniref:Class I SAM-dependent methyltransferase n=1 Tax=Geojedonia litorea TaxID=1268269 RepID=A0ABV9MZ52_9FLAO